MMADTWKGRRAKDTGDLNRALVAEHMLAGMEKPTWHWRWNPRCWRLDRVLATRKGAMDINWKVRFWILYLGPASRVWSNTEE